MKRILLLALSILCMSEPVMAAKSKSDSSTSGGASGNYTIGIGPVGNFYFTHHRPDLSPGVGALIYFDYRWSPELSTTASVMMLVQDGRNLDRGANNIVLMGLPTFDMKYYFVTNPSKWDPYAAAGIGYYAVTKGSLGRGMASGLGAEVGGGFDYYITPKISLGAAGYFRSLALLGGGATGLFPVSVLGNFGYHF